MVFATFALKTSENPQTGSGTVLYPTTQHNYMPQSRYRCGTVHIFVNTRVEISHPIIRTAALPAHQHARYNLSSTHRTPSAGHTYFIMPRPNARNLLVTFDAFGTLFKPRLPVPLQYIAVAEEYGITGLTEKQVNSSFKEGRCVRIFRDPVAYRPCWLSS